jgi:hypothetical protein
MMQIFLSHIEALLMVSLGCLLLFTGIVAFAHSQGVKTPEGSVLNNDPYLKQVLIFLWIIIFIGNTVFYV